MIDRERISISRIFGRIVGRTPLLTYNQKYCAPHFRAVANRTAAKDAREQMKQARTLSISIDIKIVKIKIRTLIGFATVLFCFLWNNHTLSSYLLELLQMNNCLHYDLTLRNNSEILGCWLWFLFCCDRTKLVRLPIITLFISVR